MHYVHYLVLKFTFAVIFMHNFWLGVNHRILDKYYTSVRPSSNTNLIITCFYIVTDVRHVSLTGMLQRGSESGRPKETESYTPHHQENGKYETNVESHVMDRVVSFMMNFEYMHSGARWLSGRMPDSQSSEPVFESALLPFRRLAIFSVSMMLQFCQLYK